MGVPGPSGTELVLVLLLFAVVAAALGEGTRIVLARRVVSWRDLEGWERLLLDFFLGGAVYYLVSALPIGAFTLPVAVGLPVVAVAGVWLFARRPGDTAGHRLAGLLRSLARPWAAVAAGSALLLLILEVSLAVPVGAGNTFDSSLLTLYTARLVDGHQLALSYLPYAPVGVLYPQGTTAWLGAAQLLLGLPSSRISLLVTPLFFGLAPLGGFDLGRRVLGSDRGGAAFAIALAGLTSWTRVLVGGSNDFVFAFPLVLLLVGQAIAWWREFPHLADAIGFGLLVGYSAALNPVGAEWLLLALPVGGLITTPRFARSARRFAVRWATAVGVGLLALVPTWYVLVKGLGSPDFIPGAGAAPSGVSHGITGAQFVGFVDPYLFRPSDVWLSPVPALRLEVAILLTLGLALLIVADRTPVGRYLATFRVLLVAGFVPLVGLLALEWAASIPHSPLAAVASLTSAGELSIWLFTLYGFVAALPLALLFEWASALSRPERSATLPLLRRSHRASLRRPALRALAPVALALLIVVPGATLTPLQLPSVLSALYQDFGNVTAADFDMLAFAGGHVPVGARVLIAPGSAAGFLPAYASDVVLLYPMVPGWPWINSSYSLVVAELRNGTLDSRGQSALSSLDVQWIAVTGWNTILWPPFQPGPILREPAQFGVWFHEGDAYLFGPPSGVP